MRLYAADLPVTAHAVNKLAEALFTNAREIPAVIENQEIVKLIQRVLSVFGLDPPRG